MPKFQLGDRLEVKAGTRDPDFPQFRLGERIHGKVIEISRAFVTIAVDEPESSFNPEEQERFRQGHYDIDEITLHASRFRKIGTVGEWEGDAT